MSKRTVSLVVLGAVALFLVVVAPDVFLLLFAGALLALFLRSCGDWIATRCGIPTGWGIAIFAVLLLASLFGAFFAFWPAITEQVEELSGRLPEAVESVRESIASYSWGERLLESVSPQGLVSAEGRSAAASAVTGTFGILGNFVIILFIGLYGAIDPAPYCRAFLLLLAPAIRIRGGEVLDAVIDTLRNWLSAQLLSMGIVGFLTFAGLWLLGVPLAPLLGLIAGLLAFIPNIGPVLAAVPGLLLAAPDGMTMVAMVASVYIVVQTLESYIVTPLIQQEKVNLPAGFVIAVQLLMSVLFGLIGLALAMPMAAMARTLTHEVYVKDYLEDDAPLQGKTR